MTNSQKRRFRKLCKDMAALLNELRGGDEPDAILFIEDGSVDLYDWPKTLDHRPDQTLCDGAVWPGAGGGGR